MSPHQQKSKAASGKKASADQPTIEQLQAQLEEERQKNQQLLLQLDAVTGGSEVRMTTLTRLLIEALDENSDYTQFYNALIDGNGDDNEQARCWLREKECADAPSLDNFGARMKSCTDCHKFEAAAPDAYTKLGELINGVLFLLQRKHRQYMDTQQQLVQSEKLAGLGELAAGLAHEINNPTGIILSRLDCMELDNKDSMTKGLREDLRVIRRHAERLRRITKSLTSFARRNKVEKRVVILQELLHELLEIVERTMQRGNVNITVELPEEPMVAFADATMIQQVFMNIVLNARDAMPGGGDLKIVGAYRPDELILEFRDNGIGMEEAVRARVFDPFFTTKDTRGTGLGMSVSYGIIKDHGGRIEVESELGAGSLFRVVLPNHSLFDDEAL